MDERLLLFLEYHYQMVGYARMDVGAQYSTAYCLLVPKDAPFAIGNIFDGKPYDYLPDEVGPLRRCID